MSQQKNVLFVITTIFLWFQLGCTNNNSELSTELSFAEKEQIKLEIQSTLEDYTIYAQSKNVKQILSFWSNSADFIHAGDGEIFGDYKKWESFVIDITPKIEEWIYWRYFNFNTIVLSRKAAACTVELEYAFMMDGEKHEVKGSWTYVFRKNANDWQVVTDNGTHIPINIDDE